MEMLQDPAVVQMQVVFLVDLIAGLGPSDRMQLGATVFEVERQITVLL